MKRLIFVFLFFLVGIVPFGYAQSGNTQSSDALTAPVPPIDCATVHAPTSCASFNDMLKAGQFNDFLGNLRIKTWVCFRQTTDSFVILHFFLPRYWATDRDETSRIQKDVHDNPQHKINDKYLRGVETSTPFSFIEFTDHTQSGKFDATLKWKKLSEQDDTQATGMSKGPDITVSQAGIVLSTTYINQAGNSFYWLTIDPDRTFTESFQSSKPAQTPDGSADVPPKGYCTEF